MQLEEFFDYKNKLMEHLVTNKNIVHLINDEIDFDDAPSLIYTQIFPFEFLPETVEHGHTFICAEVDVQQAINKTFLIPTFYIWVFTHKSKLRLPEGGVRTDKLCSEICKSMNGSREYGLGELSFYSAKRFAPMTDFNGKLMIFHAKDFNRVFDGKKKTPANRKDNVYN